MEYANKELVRRFVINYLHHKKNYKVEDASKLFDDNLEHFVKVFDVLGLDTLTKLF